MTDMISIDELLVEGKAFLDATVPPLQRRRRGVRLGQGQRPAERAGGGRPRAPRRGRGRRQGLRRRPVRRRPGLDRRTGRVRRPGPHHRARHRLRRARGRTTSCPNLSILAIALGFVGPALRSVASPEICTELLPKLYRGDLIMCQLFSEPDAGSDLASATTRAVRDGDEWLVTGQKVWTSSAHAADLGICVCRTDPDAPKHRGLTTFLVDMHADGRRRASARADDRRGQLQRGVPQTRCGCPTRCGSAT